MRKCEQSEAITDKILGLPRNIDCKFVLNFLLLLPLKITLKLLVHIRVSENSLETKVITKMLNVPMQL